LIGTQTVNDIGGYDRPMNELTLEIRRERLL